MPYIQVNSIISHFSSCQKEENKPHPESANHHQGSCNHNPIIKRSGSPLKSDQFFLVTHFTHPKKSSKFVNNFLVILLTDRQTYRQTDGCHVKQTLLGGGNEYKTSSSNLLCPALIGWRHYALMAVVCPSV